MRGLLCYAAILLLAEVWQSDAYTPLLPPTTRRAWLAHTKAALLAGSTATILSLADPPLPAHAASTKASSSNVVGAIREAQETLAILLDNWQRATEECIFADVPRELLETKNKELLLEKASTYALFDKSVSVETCKTSNRLVRDYIGATGKGPLVGVDKKLRQAMDLVEDIDDLDVYVTELESFSQSLSRAASLSYTAGTADFDSMNSFSKGERGNRNENSNLEQARKAIMEAKSSIDRMVSLLPKEAT